MLPVVVSIVVFVVLLLAGLRWQRHHQRPRLATRDGLARLNALRWRDFERNVSAALTAQGYGIAPDQDAVDRDDLILQRGDQQTLLVCKQGNGLLPTQLVKDLAREMPVRGVSRAILATPAAFDEAARAVAKGHGIELIDGEALWPLVQPVVDADGAAPAASSPSRQSQWVVWLGALAGAAVVWMIAQGFTPAPEATVTVPAPEQHAARPQPPAKDQHRAQATPPVAAAQAAPVPTDPAALERRRRDVINAVSTLAGVDRAMWSTQSTLLVHLQTEGDDPLRALCPLLERYPELAASRIQLQPPQGSSAPVRFRQCRSY